MSSGQSPEMTHKLINSLIKIGLLPKPRGNRNYEEKEMKIKAVKVLYDNNFSIRQIMKLLGINSVRQVQEWKTLPTPKRKVKGK